MRVLCTFLMVLLLVPIVAQADGPATASLPSVELPAELARVLRDYERAWQARDSVALANLFAEDGFVLQNGQPPVRGRDAIRQAYAKSGGPLSLRALAYSTDGTTGYIIGAYAQATDTPDIGKFVLALRRSGDRWLIAADIDNSNRRPSPPPAQ
jgi:ketosteroid isomerase-like protein